MIKTTALALLALLSINSPVEHQTPPNLSGEWRLIPESLATVTRRKPIDPTAPPTDPLNNPGASTPGRTGGTFECFESCKIIQAGSTLTIQHHVAGVGAKAKPHEIVLTLDGKVVQNINSEPEGTGARASTTTARWDQNRLLVTRTIGEGLARFEQVISLDKGEMTIVTKSHIGATVYPAEGPRPVTVRYKKP